MYYEEEGKISAMFGKRPGTASIRGQLYETKLLSLLLFRAQHNENIETFHLATNMAGVGEFDDICIRNKLKGHSRPIVIFIQAKHKDNANKVLTLNNKTDLGTSFKSFLTIKNKFSMSSNDIFFKGKFEETECVFVLYTNEKGDESNGNSHISYNHTHTLEFVNDLISTGSWGSYPYHTTEDEEFLYKIAVKEEIRELATRFTKFIYNNNKKDMNDELIMRYHVILAKQVIEVFDVQNDGYRRAKFRPDFFETKDDYLVLFKDKLYEETLKKHATNKINKKQEDEVQNAFKLSSFLNKPCASILGELIFESIITYKNGRLEFIDKAPLNLTLQLKNLNLSHASIEEAINRGMKDILKPFEFQVPAAFGNKDLTVKNEKRLNHIADKLLQIIKKSSPNQIITINETNTDGGLLQINGGLGSAIGNLLLYDANTKLFKFTDKFTSLEIKSKSLLHKLKNKINNLEEYRLDIQVKHFPKLVFDYNDQINKNLVKEFFSKLVFYTNQENESGVEEMLKQEIESHESNDIRSFRVKSDAIFLNFHEEVQKWWMIPKTAQYLTKDCNMYEEAKNNIINDAILSVISMMYMNEIGNIECSFKDNSITSFKSVNTSGRYVIITDVSRLTFVKLIQSLKIKNFVVLDLKYVINLPTSDLRSLNRELTKMNKEKAIIIVCDTQNITSNLQRSLQDIARAVEEKSIIVITDKILSESIMKTFKNTQLVNDEGNSLLDLTEESQINILKKAKGMFQGQEVNLDLIIDDVSVAFVKGSVLNKVLSMDAIKIGESLELPNRPYDLLRYDPTQLKYEIKDLYIDRRVSRKVSKLGHESKVLQTLHDISDDVVLITAKPGIGKSTLLSYLSIKTKEYDPTLWLLRINLLDYSKNFNTWKKDETVIDILTVLQFMCHVLLKNDLKNGKKIDVSLLNINGEVHLKNSISDEYITFQLEMFLHYFRKGNVAFLFDGFDEICPNYENQVIALINTLCTNHRKHKTWITSRPYNKIEKILQENFGILEPYVLETFSDTDQEIYFERFWKYNVDIYKLNEKQLENLKGFIDFMVKRNSEVFVDNFSRINKPQNFLLNKVYHQFMVYLQNEIKMLPMAFPLDWNYKDKFDYSRKISSRAQDLFKTHVGMGGIKDILEFVGTPLHLYLVANYFLSGIKNVKQKSNRWDLDVNTYAIYENFLESKLKTIRFKDKNKMDIDNPDILETYELVRKDFIEMHKKLAAYAIFEVKGQKIFNKQDLDEIAFLMEKVKKGREKTGLIYSISNNIPQFIHMTFTEYFAVEHVSDLLKREKNIDKQKSICDFIINTMIFESPLNVLNIMDQKLTMDIDFAQCIKSHNKYIFEIIMCIPISDSNKIKSPLFETISKNLNNFVSIFMSILEDNVNNNNLDEFINIIGKTGFLRIAVARRYDDLFVNVLKLIRKINVAKWRQVLSDPKYYSDDFATTFRLQGVLGQHYLNYFITTEVCRLESLMTNNEEA